MSSTYYEERNIASLLHIQWVFLCHRVDDFLYCLRLSVLLPDDWYLVKFTLRSGPMGVEDGLIRT